MRIKSKNKIFPAVSLIAIFAILAVLFMSVLSFAPVSVSAEAGNTAYPEGGNFDYTLNFDVNGSDATTNHEQRFSDTDQSQTSVVGANNGRYRKRRLDLNALLGIYTNSHSTISSTEATNYNSNAYTLATSGNDDLIYNSFEEYVSITPYRSGSGVSAIDFEVHKYKTDPMPFAAIVFEKKANAVNVPVPQRITVYLQFNIDSTFAPVSSGSVSVSREESIYLAQDRVEKPVKFELANNDTKTYSLKDLIGNDLLYGKRSSDAVPIMENPDTSKPWALRDVSNFRITNASIGSVISSANIKISSGTIDGITTPIITINSSFSQSRVEATRDENGIVQFWNNEHYLSFTLTDNKGNSVTVNKRVYFTSEAAPALRTTYYMPQSLNATSAYQYVGTEGGSATYTDKDSNASMSEVVSKPDSTILSAGYSQVRVLPSYLCDFPTRGKMYFDSTKTENDIEISPRGVVSIDIEKTGSTVHYYRITAIGKGSAVVHFPILYTSDEGVDEKPITVPVVFEVYGSYTLKDLAIEGKSSVPFSTVTDENFKELIDDDFYLNSVEVSDGDSERIMQEFRNNLLTITPLSSGSATLKLGFIDLAGRQIYLDWKVSINIEGGDPTGDWPLVYRILLFVGIGILCLAIILFIVWLFIRAISKRRQEENETMAPTSAYIIKLNSTIAAAQAQQRAATTQAFNTAQTQMLALGAGPTTTGAPPPDTLQLGAGMPTSTTTFINNETTNNYATGSSGSDAPNQKDDIYIPLSDDELLERIFVEKYEPRGMARRSFFKSKDLQSRELEKEKARIRDDVRDGMTIEEACKSISERQAAQSASNASVTNDAPQTEEVPEFSIINILGFDPASALVEEPVEQVQPTDESIPEEVAMKNAENRLAHLEKEMEVLTKRIEKAKQEMEKMNGSLDETKNGIQMKEESNAALRKSIEDLEFKLATAKNKEKDKLIKDIENKEHVISSNKDIIAKLQEELSQKQTNYDTLSGILADYENKNAAASEEHDKLVEEVEKAREEYREAKELLEKAKKAAAVKEKRTRLRPLLETVNSLDYEIRELGDKVEKESKEKDTLKAEVSDIQKQMLNTNDVSLVSELSARMSEINKSVAELDKSIAAANKTKADKTIQFNGERRKTNEFIDREELEVEDVVAEEDDIIAKRAFDDYMSSAKNEREFAEKELVRLQEAYDELVAGYDTEVMNIAVKTAASVKEAEDALAATQASLEELNANMENASDDDKLMMSIDQMSLNEQVEKLTKEVSELQASAAKAKVEYQMEYDSKLEETKKLIEDAQKAYDEASAKVDESMNKVNPLDLILSGNGIISQDRKRMEAENLKKQLELSKSAMEQAKLQAKAAQEEAERAILDAQRASEESRQEAERVAQEAVARAEEARLAAEQKAAEEAEAARLEMERLKQAAEEEKRRVSEEAEEEKRRIVEEAEQAKREAEEAKIAAEQKAAEEAEIAKKEAEEAKLAAEARAEEEAERVRREVEEAKKRSEEEAEKIKKEAEEKAAKDREARDAEEKRIKEKIEHKKARILEMRAELKNITDEASAKALKEKFYNEQVKLDDDEKSTTELTDLLNKCISDADHAAEVSMYKALANKAPKRVVKKVTERIHQVPKKKGARPGARPTRPGARPSARPARPGARPTRPGARPTRPGGPRPTRPNRPR